MSSKEKEPPALKRQFELIPKLLNGALAGIIAVTCCFPLDLVKTRLQRQQPGPQGELMYKNIFDCFVKTFRSEGFFGMYRGYGVNVFLITPEKVIKFAANDYFRHHLSSATGELTMVNQILAGGLAGAFQLSVTTPMELLKILMQDSGRVAVEAKDSGKKVKRTSATALALAMFKDKGIAGLYRGILATALRDISFSMVYFPMLAELNDLGPLRPDNTGLTVSWWTFFSGLFSASTSALLVTPFDVVKTRLQGMTDADTAVKFKGIVDCFSKTFRNEGFKALFKGGLCRMMVIAPFFGIAQTVYIYGVAERLLGYELRKSI